jgi:hypothetical protein
MGHRAWFTFTQTAREAHDLAVHLEDTDSHEWFVYGVNFVARLNEPFDKDKPFAIAWSSDGSSALKEVGEYARNTHLLDEMSAKWLRNPEKYGTLLSLEELKALSEAE